MKKINLRRETIRNLSSSTLGRVRGGGLPNTNTQIICVDTDGTSCFPGGSLATCTNSATCPAATFGC